MGGALPKQYFAHWVAGPILMRSLKFLQLDKQIELILVPPGSEFWVREKLCESYKFLISSSGGGGRNSRFQSVRKNGLKSTFPSIYWPCLRFHDGVRPFVDPKVIYNEKFLRWQGKYGSAIAVVPAKRFHPESHWWRKVFFTKERHHYRLVQTPQTFQVSQIKVAFRGWRTSSSSQTIPP